MPISAVAKVAIQVGVMAAGMAITALQKFEGSRLTDLNATTADYGTPVPILWGRKRIETPIFFAEELREVKKQSKTKGGKYTEYTYFGTWAVAISDAPIDKVLRIWFDRHLIFDATGAGPMYPFPFTDVQAVVRDLLAKFGSQGKFMRIYTGSELQEPDPRMELTVEAAEGEGACPAYRGVSYIMFEEVPLEKFGNRMPQVSVEATTLGTDIYPFTEKPYLGPFLRDFSGVHLSADGNTLFWVMLDKWEAWDLFSFSRIGGGTLPDSISTGNIVVARVDNGDFYAPGTSGGSDALLRYRAPGYLLSDEAVLLDSAGRYAHSFKVGKDEFVGIAGDGFSTMSQFYRVENGRLFSEDVGFTVDVYVSDGENIWAIGTVEAGGASRPIDVMFKCVYGFRRGLSATFSTGSSSIGFHSVAALYYPEDRSVVLSAIGAGPQHLMKVFLPGLTLAANVSVTIRFGLTEKQFLNWRGGDSIWLTNASDALEYSLADLSLLRTVNTADWTGADGASFGTLYVPQANALLSATITNPVAPGTGGDMTMRYLDRASGNGVSLESICDDVASRVDATGCDFTAFEGIVIPGFGFTQGAAKAIIEPLIEIHDADVRPHNFGLQGVLRGAASADTIDVAFMVPDGDNRYSITRAVDTDLPQTVVLTFADINKDQQPNTAQSFKRGSDSVRNLTLDASTYATDVDSARLLADRHLRRRWYGAERYKFSVGRRSIGLEPGDVVTGGFDDVTRTLRINKIIVGANGIASIEGDRDTPAIAVLGTATGAPSSGQTEDSIRPAGPTNGFVLDLPLVQDADDQSTPFLYYGAGPYDVDAFWPGAVFSVSEDGDSEYVTGWAQVSSSTRITAGYTTEALASASPSIIDRASSVTIQLQSGSLTSTTEADLLLDETLNLALIGDELVQFTTATPGAGDTYTLSGFRRGARGTEQHIAAHVAGERFALMDGNVFSRTVTASEIGDTDTYLATTQGRDGGFPQELAFTAAAHRPYSPVHGVLTLAAGDWSITATRRTRIGGFNVDGISPPLGETAEMWEADILDGPDVVRTLVGTSLPLSYTAAMQTADFGGAQTSLAVNLYQISPALSLRGFPLAIAA